MCKEITMSIHDFMEIQRNKNLTIDKNNMKTLDAMVGRILNDKKLKMIVLTSIAYTSMTIMAYAEPLDELRHAKNEIVLVLQVCIVIICIVMCLLNIGKSLIGGRSNDIGEIVMRYLTATIGVCVVPKIFTWIAHLCNINI